MCAISCMAVAAMAASCVSNPNKKAAADSTATAQTADVEEGFVAIFDGKTFDGWRGYNRTDVPSAWTIEDGCIKINESGMGEAGAKDGGDIIFANKKFKNFELAFDWKVDKGANSGVFYLAQEIPNQPIYISAPEYQVLDNENHPDAKLGVDGNRQSASLYDMIPAKPQNSKPFGEWNTAKSSYMTEPWLTSRTARRSWNTTCGPRNGKRCSTTANSARTNGRKPTNCC